MRRRTHEDYLRVIRAYRKAPTTPLKALAKRFNLPLRTLARVVAVAKKPDSGYPEPLPKTHLSHRPNGRPKKADYIVLHRLLRRNHKWSLRTLLKEYNSLVDKQERISLSSLYRYLGNTGTWFDTRGTTRGRKPRWSSDTRPRTKKEWTKSWSDYRIRKGLGQPTRLEIDDYLRSVGKKNITD